MNAILNVSLDDQVCPNGTIEHRYNIVRAALRLCFAGVVGEIQNVSYDGPDGPVREHCGVFAVEFDVHPVIVEDALHAVARSLGQDCVAILYDTGVGKCVGPGAERWPFDAAHFNLPAAHLQAAAA